jgi:uncharacterized protein YdhG (YjbR/CyaY superfamily)
MKRVPSSRGRADVRGPADVDEYLATLPAARRAALQTLRKTIAAAAPRAEEGFSYSLPAFRLGGRPLVCYGAAAKGHCSFFPMSPAVIEAHAADLTRWETSKGTIRFAPDTPLPVALIRKIVRARIAELEGKRK